MTRGPQLHADFVVIKFSPSMVASLFYDMNGPIRRDAMK